MMTLLSILLLGFFLGMRHATDSDHVVAVTTIVSRQRTVGSAALTGIFWGIGHSLTLLVVGGAIIFFSIVIPERLGLSLEFCVALMLVLLGVVNLPSPCDLCASIRFSLPKNMSMSIGTAITCTRMLTATNQETTVTMRIQCRLRAWIASSVA